MSLEGSFFGGVAAEKLDFLRPDGVVGGFEVFGELKKFGVMHEGLETGKANFPLAKRCMAVDARAEGF